MLKMEAEGHKLRGNYLCASVPHHEHVWQNGGKAPCTLNLDTCWRGNSQLHAPATLPPKKELWFLLKMRLGGCQNQCGRSGKEKPQCLCRESNLVIQPIVITTDSTSWADKESVLDELTVFWPKNSTVF
jgi:hypothetical protein